MAKCFLFFYVAGSHFNPVVFAEQFVMGLNALALSTWFTITARLCLTQLANEPCNLSYIVLWNAGITVLGPENTEQFIVYTEDLFTVIV